MSNSANDSLMKYEIYPMQQNNILKYPLAE